MATTQELLTQLASCRDDLADNLTTQGVDATNMETLTELIPKVLDIEVGGDSIGWQPHPDWWDIRTMVDTGYIPWLGETLTNVRYGYIVSDGTNTTTLVAGYQYYLSDGTIYDGNAAVIHTWDITKDKECSDGYMTRCVIVCSNSRDVIISQRNFSYDGINSIYVYTGDCNIISMTFSGMIDAAYSNRTIQAFECNESTTVGTLISNIFYNCYSLVNVVLPNGWPTNSGVFVYCHALKRVIMPVTLTTLGPTQFGYCYALQTVIAPGIITVGSNAFNNCYSLVSILISKTINSSFSLSSSIYFSVLALENIILGFVDRTGITALTFTIGSTNLAKLSDEIKAVATSKNITLA